VGGRPVVRAELFALPTARPNAQANAVLARDFLDVDTILLNRPFVLIMVEHG
jgi:hypothetical protein